MNPEQRLAEIRTRAAEIQALLNEDDADLDALTTEYEQLEEERTKLAAKISLRTRIAAGNEPNATALPKPEDNPLAQRAGTVPSNVLQLRWDEAIETDEYRSAWLKSMSGKPLTSEERGFFDKANEEYRAFTHTTENTAVLIPKTIVAGIWDRAAEISSLWSDVKKFFVNGNLTLIKGNRNGGSEAEWYEEADEVDTKELQFATLDLTGCELARAIQVTWKLRKMAMPEFEAYITSEIGYKMGKALAYGTYSGKGKPGAGDAFKPEPLGIKTALAGEADTPQIVSYEATGATWENITAVMAALGTDYAAGASFYAKQKTIFTVLANIKDQQGRPIFVPDPTSGGVGRILGVVVKPDDALPEGEIMLGNLNRGYAANINEDVTMYREDHVRKRLTDYMGYAIVDGEPVDTEAFVILQPAVAEPAQG